MTDNTSSHLIQTLTTSMSLISETEEPKEISQIIKKLLLDFSCSDHAALLLFDQKKQTLDNKHTDKSYSMIDPVGILGEAFLTKKPAFYNHLASEKNYVQSIDNPNELKLRSQIVLPIVENEELLGIVRTCRSIRYKQPYSKKDLDLLYSLHAFLIKMVHILRADNQAIKSVDLTKINESIKSTTKKKEQPSDSSMMHFFSNTVHDIRTPANSLYGFLELIEESVEDKRLKEFIAHAKESAKFINTLTDTILEQAKEDHLIHSSTPSTVNSIKFFSQTANIFSSDMSAKHINYLIYLDPMLPKEIKIDMLKLKRVLINLLGNAYKFTPNGNRIDFKIKFDAKRQKLKISVSDQGIGIDPSRQKEIFKAFEQAEEDTGKHFGGTGLGLSISAKYVSEMGGKLKLKSAPEKGSKFYFSIPVEIVNADPSYEKFKDLKKKITILTNCKNCINPLNIAEYLLELGMDRENVLISDTLEPDTTHLYCFQHKLSPEILRIVKEKNIEILIIEESLFSLSKNKSLAHYNIISENTYYGDLVHSTAYFEKKKKILIADDNKINITLLKSILETEFVEITAATNGLEALNLLKDACSNGLPFDAVFIDKHMPSISGPDVIHNYREYENSIQTNTPLFAISITGDPAMPEEEKKLYDLIIKKPFNTEVVRSAIAQMKQRHQMTQQASEYIMKEPA